MDLSIVIVSYNTRALLLQCLESVYRTVGRVRFEVWVVDNASSDGSVEAVNKRYPDVLTIKNKENRGFAAANNQALRKMNGRYALLLNSDAMLTTGALEKLFVFMENKKEAGMACGQLLNPDGSRQNSFANFPTLLSLVLNESLLKKLWPRRYPSKYRTYREPLMIESCIGACMIVRKAAMDNAGMLDERYFFFMEETDWALTFKKAGWDSFFYSRRQHISLSGTKCGKRRGLPHHVLPFTLPVHPPMASPVVSAFWCGHRSAPGGKHGDEPDCSGCFFGPSWSDAAALCSVFKNRRVALQGMPVTGYRGCHGR